MKNSIKQIWLIASLLILGNQVIAGTFTSNGTGGGLWNISSSWIAQNDSDGIPDSDDDVVIIDGDQIIWDTIVNCHDLTLMPGSEIACFNSKIIWIHGNYQNSGIENGNGIYYFNGLNKSISGSGIFDPYSRWVFRKSYFINNDVVAQKKGWTYVYNGAVITNTGDITLYGLIKSGNIIGKWINSTGSKLCLKSHLITIKLDVSTYENTVTTCYTSTSARLPVSINNTFHHLEIGSSTKLVYLLSNITVNGNLTVLPGGDFKMNGYNIHLKGNFSNYQTFIQPDNSTLFLDGSTPQLMESFIAPTPLSNLVIDNASGVTAGGYEYFTISNSLIIANGEFNLEKNRIMLLSDQNKTAYIGSSNGTLTGTMIIQRYISNRNDGYSDLSSPVSSIMFEDLADDLDLAFNAYIPNYSSPSCWGYNESSWDYFAIETIDQTMLPGHGYEIYLDNDGDTTTSFTGTTVDFMGTPNIGTVSVPVTADNDGWNLVGNPYASPIDWTHFRNNCGLPLNTQFQYYDETIGDFNIGTDGEIIAAAQGFWIEATQTGNINFQESDKVTNPTSFFRSTNDLTFSLRVSSDMNRFTSNTFLRFDENTSIRFDNGWDMKFLKPASKEAPALYSVSPENIKMKLNCIKDTDTAIIPIHFKAGISGNYEISTTELETLKEAGFDNIVLEDRLTNKKHDLENGSYYFTATINDMPERFMLHLTKSSSISEEKTEWFSIKQTSNGAEIEFAINNNLPVSVSVYNLSGQEIITSLTDPGSHFPMKITLPGEFSGIYFIQVINGENSETKKLYHN